MKWHKQLKVKICVLLVHIGLEVEVLIRKQLLTIRLIKVNVFIQAVHGKIKIVKRRRQWSETLDRSVNTVLGPIRGRE